jgi:hypothetical protein
VKLSPPQQITVPQIVPTIKSNKTAPIEIGAIIFHPGFQVQDIAMNNARRG